MPQAPIEEVLTQSLNAEQKAAAVDPNREVLTLACAGSGKSRTLAFRIARLLAEGVEPRAIVAFTFTEKAAESIKRRVAQALVAVGIEPTVMGAMYLGTIHGYCQQMLGEIDARFRQFEVLDTNRFKLFALSRYPSLAINTVRSRTGTKNYPKGSQFRTIAKIVDTWSTMNDEMIKLADVAADDDDLAAVLEKLHEAMTRDQFIDFSYMIRLVVDRLQADDERALMATEHIRHLMVDEYQDVNPAQESLIRALHPRLESLFVVGDDDQAIYSWRGADVSNILEFQDRYSTASVHTLSTNFRSTAAIVRSSAAFIDQELGAKRMDKSPVAHRDASPQQFGRFLFPDRDDEAAWVAERIQTLIGTRYIEYKPDGTVDRVRGLTPGDFAILMRSTRQPETSGDFPRHFPFTSSLAELEIPYSLESGGGPFDRPQVAVLRDCFLMLQEENPNRTKARDFFESHVSPSYQDADFRSFAEVLGRWGREIHTPYNPQATRRRVYPQKLVHELLEAFGIQRSYFDDAVMRDIGIFSRMILDVEVVYMSVDSTQRFREICNFLRYIAEDGYDTSTDDMLQKPDAVTIATVHKMKGLEFPVVFVVDVESGRFPGNRRKYEGWLPDSVINAALSRGAYLSEPDAEARLFYTALTRAERFLYISGSQHLPGGKQKKKLSNYALRLQDDTLEEDPAVMPASLNRCPPSARVDETVLPTSFSDIRYYLKCPMDYRFRKRFGYSPAVPELFGFGVTVHTALGKLHEQYHTSVPTADEAEAIAHDVFHLKHIHESRDPINRPGGYERARDSAAKILRTYTEGFDQDFVQSKQIEVRFEIPAEGTVITGDIDLLIREDAEGNITEASVIDFKAMKGGDSPISEETELHWTELALQVQLYAKAAREVLGENARTGSVHLLKDNQRIEVPVSDAAIQAAIENVEWAVDRIIAGDYPMRPERNKCDACDFRLLCSKQAQTFQVDTPPPQIHVPLENGNMMARLYSEYSAG